MTSAARLEGKYLVDAASGCWNWTGATSDKGKWVYGIVMHFGKLRMAHRVMFERERGSIPEGLELDHLCRNTRCINPAHLDPVTHQENIRRGIRFNSLKTECKRGHFLSGENLYVRPDGHRECRICRANQWQAYKERQAA